MDITYDQVSEFIYNEFRKFLIETEYKKTVKPSTFVNPTYNDILERVHQVIENIVQTLKLNEPMLTNMTHGW